MSKILHIFWFEYWHSIKRPGYLLFTFLFPIVIFLIPSVVGIILLLAIRAAIPDPDPRPIGLVDDVALTVDVNPLPSDPVEIIRYPTLAAAEADLASETIQAYYHIQADYWDTGHIEAVYTTPPSLFVDDMIPSLVRKLIREKIPPDMLSRYRYGAIITQHDVTTETEAGEDIPPPPQKTETDWMIVFSITFFVFQVNIFSAARIFDGITSEANNRTIEILLSSVTPLQFMVGKLAGLIAVGLTQVAVWGGGILIIILGVGYVQNINIIQFLISWKPLPLVLSVLFGAYIMQQIIAAALGLLRVAGGLGIQLFNGFGLITTFSLFYAMYVVPRSPDTILAFITSLFPLTSPVVLPIRYVVSTVPTWEVVVAQLLLWLTNLLGILWLRNLLQANLVKYSPNLKLWQRFKAWRASKVAG